MLMATYKVIQDVEAEDKLIWQLSFRQFVYALIAAVFLYFSYLFVYKGVAFMCVVSLPIALFCGFLAYPFGKDQPTEVWALAKLRFFTKPRRRIWAQSGVKELVTVTAPKHVEVDLTNGLNEAQVKSRLQALADTIDSRGWSLKNTDGVYQSQVLSDSDRLINSSSLPNDVPEDLARANDMLDVNANPIAQKMDELLISNSNKHRQELIDNLDQMREHESVKKEGLIKPKIASTASGSTYSASTNDDDDGQLKAKKMPRAKALKSHKSKPVSPSSKQSTDRADPDIINLARRNDLNVNVIGHEINKARGVDVDSSGGEVTISLH